MSNYPKKRFGLAAFWLSWTLLIVSFAVWRLFENPDTITVHGVAALTAVLGMPAAFIALYKWWNSRNG